MQFYTEIINAIAQLVDTYSRPFWWLDPSEGLVVIGTLVLFGFIQLMDSLVVGLANWLIYNERLLQWFFGLLPEIVLGIMITYVLTYLALQLGRGTNKKKLTWKTRTTLKATLLVVISLYVVQLGSGCHAQFFSGYLAVSPFSTLLKLLTAITSFFVLNHSKAYILLHKRHLLEYPLVLTLATLFMLLLISASHLVSAFLALVGFSLNLYVLILFDAPTAIAREAGIKYFYLSTFSSGLMLYGIFLLFMVLGTGHFFEISQTLATNSELLETGRHLIHCAVIFLLVGLFFKLSAFPGHLWAAEVYEGSPDPVTAFFMLPVKISVLAFVIQLLTTALDPVIVFWQPIIALSAGGSLVWGCLAAVAENKTKRFLAYASINQMGLLLLGVATGSFEGYRATILYLCVYVIMNICFLAVFFSIKTFGNTYLNGFIYVGRGGWWKARWALTVTLFSMAGIPPLAGFFGKYYLLLHAQEQGLYVLVILGLATSLVSTYYYLRIVRFIWFEGTEFTRYRPSPRTFRGPLTEHWLERLQHTSNALWYFILFAPVIFQMLDDTMEGLLKFPLPTTPDVRAELYLDVRNGELYLGRNLR